ncbi:MAG: SDR family oxidoreductase [Pseudomonadota bacterium]|nr:SDR family oxidoreductase [Pseudomonadota bacterium]
MELEGREIIVTGGTGALGTVVVGALLDSGARCHVPYTRVRSNARFPHTDRVTLVPGCDLTVEANVVALYRNVPKLWASIHLAGAFEMGAIEDTDQGALRRMIDVNLVTCYLCCRAAARTFGEPGGRIVNVAARPALEPRLASGMTAYGISKAGVAALTVSLAAELAPRNILVNAVAPSVIDSLANRAAMPDAATDAWPTPKEIAATILFLASPSNRITSGAVLPAYGRA